MKPKLNSAHDHTYDAIFQHPVARNLHWRDVRSLLVAIADVVQEHGDTLKITRNAQTLVVHRPVRDGMNDVAELMKIRHFLEQSGANLPSEVPEGAHLQG